MRNRFTQYCRRNLDFAISDYRFYNSLALSALDASFSARAHYETVINVLERFCVWATQHGVHLNWNPQLECPHRNQQITVSHVIALLHDQTPESLADIVQNRSRIARRLKSSLFIEMLGVLQQYNIDTYQDIQAQFDNLDFRTALLNLGGVGPATLNYLFMLAGYPNEIKIDVWIRRFAADATGAHNLTDDQIRELFVYAANELGITPRHLDHMAWVFQKNHNQ